MLGHVRIDASESVTRPRVEVEGRDVSHLLSGVRVSMAAGRVPQVLLEHVAGASFDGVAEVSVAPEFDPAALITEWLAGIDADELERVALERTGGFEGESVGTSMLNTLKGWAGGDHDRT